MFDSKVQGLKMLLHATDFHSLMHPCFTLCRLLGIFPYRIDALAFAISKPRYVLSTAVICVYCAFYLLHMRDLISGTIAYGKVVDLLDDVCYFTLKGSVVVVTHVLSISRMRLLQTVMGISSQLSRESYRKLSRLVHAKDVLGTVLILLENYVYVYKSFEPNSSALTILVWLYVDLLVFQSNMLYTNCVCVLKACYEKINDDLVHVQEPVNNTQPVPSSICHEWSQLTLMKLKTLMKQHLMISRIVHTLNVIFSLQLLATISQSFVEVTSQLYLCIVKWQGEVLITLDRHIFDSFLSTMAHHFIIITLIVWACETCKSQARKIITTIYDVRNGTRNENIKAEVVGNI